MKRTLIIVSILISTFAIGVVANNAMREPMEIKSAVTVHKTATCGCCANYAGYLRTNGYVFTVVDHADNDQLAVEKRNLGVPISLDSCHTTVFDEEKYFVEGHIPLEAIDKMLAEKPAIKGIGMPGMPSASPGMPGKKTELFNISQVSLDGATSNFITM